MEKTGMVKTEIATQKVRWKHVSFVEETNCTDKIDGHAYEWITGDEAAAIRKQHPKLVCAIVRYTKCGKVNHSM